MRLAATFISIFSAGIFILATTSCTVEPKSKLEGKSELSKLEGPDTGSIHKTLQTQADQAIVNGDFRRAAQMYRQLHDRMPDKKEYAVSLADCLRRAGDNEEALKTIDALLKTNPSDAAVLEVKGLALMNIGEFIEASQLFDKVMSIDGKRWRTLNAVGILFAIKKMHPQAVQYYNAALKESPDNPSILNNLGLSYAMEKQFDQAIDAFLRARSHLDANSTELKHVDMNLALVYAIEGKLDDAEQVAAPHLSKSALYNNMGVYADIAKNRELARSYLNMALTQNSTYYERAWKNLNAISDESGENNGRRQGDDLAEGNAVEKKAPVKQAKKAERKRKEAPVEEGRAVMLPDAADSDTKTQAGDTLSGGKKADSKMEEKAATPNKSALSPAPASPAQAPQEPMGGNVAGVSTVMAPPALKPASSDNAGKDVPSQGGLPFSSPAP